MKKIISLCLTFILIVGCIGTVAYAEETMPSLLFDLDIQTAPDGTYTIKDASTSANNKAGKVNIIYGQGKTSDESLKPILGENSYGTPYIQFGELDDAGKVINTDRPMQVDLGTDRNTEGGVNDSYANRNALTFETWVNLKDIEEYITMWSWKSFFSLTGRQNGTSLHPNIRGALQPTLDINPTRNPKTMTIEMTPDIGTTKYTQGDENTIREEYWGSYMGDRTGTKLANSSNIYDTMTGDKWAHMVFVRKWTPYEPAKEGTYTGKWNYDIYVNGKNMGSVEKDTVERVDYNNVSYSNAWIDYDTLLLGRGNAAISNNGIMVQMADFRLWDGALTETQVIKAYKDTRAGFMDVIDGVAYLRDNETAVAISFDGSVTDIVIPETVGGYPVTGIGSAFAGSNIESIYIPDTVTSIGNYAFSGCDSLTSISIPDSVTSIGEYAFENCASLTSVTIPDGVTSIGSSAFGGCSSLKDITIPDSVTSIGGSAFENCASLTSVTIPDGVTSIGYEVFRNCSNLTSINIPDGVTSIGNYAFSGCTNLTSIDIPDGVTSIGNYAFYNCTSLTNITIPDSVTSIRSGVFYNCTSLTSVTIPDSVTSIGGSAFENCSSLTSVTIPDGVTSIGSRAFGGCTNLKSITIPDSVTSIGDYAFYWCSRLEKIIVSDENMYYSSDEGGVLFNKDKTTIIQYPLGMTNTSYIIPEGVIRIGAYAFVGCNSLTTISIPDSVASIEDWAFSGCNSLTTVNYSADETAWNEIYIGIYNSCLTDAQRNYFRYMIPAPPEPFTINSITIKDLSGNELSEIPDGKFLATVSITNTSSYSDAMVVLAQYSALGKFNGLLYVNVEDMPKDSTFKLTIPVDNTACDVDSLKAFVWDSFETVMPLGNSVSFPVE